MISYPLRTSKEEPFWVTGESDAVWFDLFFGFFDGRIFLTKFQKTACIIFQIQVFMRELLDIPILQALKYIWRRQ